MARSSPFQGEDTDSNSVRGTNYGVVAQLVVHLIVDQTVASSSLVYSAKQCRMSSN